MQLQSRMDNIVRIAGMGMNVYWMKLWLFTGAIETQYSSFLVASEAYPGMGWRMCVELIIGCAQPYGWKITSVETNLMMDQGLEWVIGGDRSGLQSIFVCGCDL